MVLTNENLLDIITEASYRLHKEIKTAYKNGNLGGYLSSVGMIDLMPKEESSLYDTDPYGKILIIGQANIRDNEIYGCLKEYGLDKERVELHLGYDKAMNYSFKKLQYKSSYRLILIGPVPHSGVAKGDKSSIITQIETTDGYPKVIRLSDGNGLKITKTSIKKAIEQEIRERYILI